MIDLRTHDGGEGLAVASLAEMYSKMPPAFS
jgi:hypothetical protein